MRVSNAMFRAVTSAHARSEGSVFRKTGEQAVGGLRGVGNINGTELWLVASSSGLGLLDAKTGERIARAPNLPPGYPEATPGIGSADGKLVRIVGIDGGSLPLSTPDGWRLCCDMSVGIWLTPPGIATDMPSPHIEVLRVRLEELRVGGFSASGDSLVLGDARTLHLFAR
jgi:hypothetical protein